MRVATAAYDKNGVLVYPKKFYNGFSPTSNRLTTGAGFWHTTTMQFRDDYSRNAALYEAIKLVHESHGTVFRVQADCIEDNHHTSYYFTMFYVIEEAHVDRCTEHAATALAKGVHPDFVYPPDPILRYGPDWNPFPKPAGAPVVPDLNLGPAPKPKELGFDYATA